MQVVSERRFPVVLLKSGHYSMSLPEGVLVEFEWLYTYDSKLVSLSSKEASKIRRKGGEPWKVDSPKTPWAILLIDKKQTYARITVYHYGQKIQDYTTSPRQNEYNLGNLYVEGGYELPIGESIIRLTSDGTKVTKIKGKTFGQYTHPKEIVIQLLSLVSKQKDRSP